MNAVTDIEKEIELACKKSIKTKTPLEVKYVKYLMEWIENLQHTQSRMKFDDSDLGWG